MIEQWNANPSKGPDQRQPSKYLLDHEVFFYIFDAALMLLNSVILNIWHPARYLPRDNKVYLARDGKTELSGPGWVDGRRWWFSWLDPFDLVGLAVGRDSRNKFWEQQQQVEGEVDGLGNDLVQGPQGEVVGGNDGGKKQGHETVVMDEIYQQQQQQQQQQQ